MAQFWCLAVSLVLSSFCQGVARNGYNYDYPLLPPRPLTEYVLPVLEYDDCAEGGRGCDVSLETSYGTPDTLDPEVEVCPPNLKVVTVTRAVPSTVYDTKTKVLFKTVFAEVTETEVVTTTSLQQEVITAQANPVFQTTTEVLTDTRYITRAQYFTETKEVTETEFETATETVFKVRTQFLTKTQTRYKVQTQYKTQHESHFHTDYRTQLQYITKTHTIPQYVTKTLSVPYPAYQTVTSTHFHNNYVTITKTTQAVQAVPVYQTVTHTQYQQRLVTVTRTAQQQVPVYQTLTSTLYQSRVIYQTVQAPCAPMAPVKTGYYGNHL